MKEVFVDVEDCYIRMSLRNPSKQAELILKGIAHLLKGVDALNMWDRFNDELFTLIHNLNP